MITTQKETPMTKNIHILYLLIMISTLIHAGKIAPTTQDIRAFPLAEDTLTLQASYDRVNGGIDILSLNKTPSTPYSALGSSLGLDFSLGYGAKEYLTLYYKIKAQNIRYGQNAHYKQDTLKNRQQELYARINFYDSPQYSFDDLSLDVGYIHNSADDFATLKDLTDNSYYLRLLWGSKLKSSLFNFYTGVKYTSKKKSNEKAFSLGATHTVEFSHYILDTRYEYIRIIARKEGLGKNKSNHLLDMNLARSINDSWLIFIGTSLMTNQFNGLIPSLYNAQTEASFDKTYHYLKLGFVYNFSAKNLK